MRLRRGQVEVKTLQDASEKSNVFNPQILACDALATPCDALETPRDGLEEPAHREDSLETRLRLKRVSSESSRCAGYLIRFSLDF